MALLTLKLPQKHGPAKNATKCTKVQSARNRDLVRTFITNFHVMLDEKTTKLEAAALSIGSAYVIATDNYEKALADADRREAAKTQIFFSLLTVATSGMLSWAVETAKLSRQTVNQALDSEVQKLAAATGHSELIKQIGENIAEGQNALSARELFTSFFKDTMAAGLGEGFSALSPVVPQAFLEPEPSRPGSMEPLVFQNELQIAICNLKRHALGYLVNLGNKLEKSPTGCWDGFDPNEFQKARDKWLGTVDGFAGGKKLPPTGDMAADLERGMWALWLLQLHSGDVVYAAKAGIIKQENYNSIPGGKVADRLHELKILEQAGVQLHWYQVAEKEDRPLIDWARRFRVKPWASGAARSQAKGK